MFRVKRVYEAPASADGCRVLVDRLWPRGLSKQAAAVDAWLRQIAPSAALRKWFNHDPARWPAFSERYQVELQSPERAEALATLRALEQDHDAVTLLFAAREEQLNHARLLIKILTGGK